MSESNWTPVEAALYEMLRSLRPVWDELALPAEERDEVEALLAQAEQGQLGALNRARRRLRRHPQVGPWLEAARERLLEEEHLRIVTLPGDPEPQPRLAYRCPTPGCAYVWYQRVAGITPPPCPVHNCDLEPASHTL